MSHPFDFNCTHMPTDIGTQFDFHVRDAAKWPHKRMDIFWTLVKKGSGCWEWLGEKNETGYGRFFLGGKRFFAHRISYSILKVPLLDSQPLDHLCRNRGCVNPEHLELVTHQENILRGVGPAAKNAKKIHCPNGHPYDLLDFGKRRCKICRTPQRAKYWKKYIAKGGRK